MTEYISIYHILQQICPIVTVSLSINFGSHWHVGQLQMRALQRIQKQENS